ncbi:MAG: hypothetical protein V1792_03430, partial [Pseudomonadota bacterium]
MNESDHEEHLVPIKDLLKHAHVSVETLNYLENADHFKHIIKSVDGVDWGRRYTRNTAEIVALLMKGCHSCANLREANDTALRAIAQKKLRAELAKEPGTFVMMDPKAIKTYPRFESLHGIDQDLLTDLTNNMGIEGFDPSQPIVLAIWPGQPEPVLADGKLRVNAAITAGIKQVLVLIRYFIDEEAVLEFIAWVQTHRRPTDDWVLYRLISEFDSLMQRGGDRRSEDAKSK